MLVVTRHDTQHATSNLPWRYLTSSSDKTQMNFTMHAVDDATAPPALYLFHRVHQERVSLRVRVRVRVLYLCWLLRNTTRNALRAIPRGTTWQARPTRRRRTSPCTPLSTRPHVSALFYEIANFLLVMPLVMRLGCDLTFIDVTVHLLKHACRARHPPAVCSGSWRAASSIASNQAAMVSTCAHFTNPGLERRKAATPRLCQVGDCQVTVR